MPIAYTYHILKSAIASGYLNSLPYISLNMEQRLFNVFVSYFFQVEDQGDKIDADDRNVIRTQIVELMLNSPESLQKQVLYNIMSAQVP